MVVAAVLLESEMIFCSNLPNDQDMIKALGSLAIPMPLDIADCWFSGADVSLVAIERKKVGDMTSCICDGRYLAQAVKSKEYGAGVLVLIVEGEPYPMPETGLLSIPVWRPFMDGKGINRKRQEWELVKPTMAYSRFDQYLTELAYLAGIIVKRTRDVHETASVIKALYAWFQKPLDSHNSLHQFYTPSPRRVQLSRPSLVRRVAKELDGIGWERSGAVAAKFHTVREMVDGSVKDWMSVDGIGKKTAEKVVNSLNGGKK